MFFACFVFYAVIVIFILFRKLNMMDLSDSAEQKGIKMSPIELSQFVSFIKRNKLQTETFVIGHNQCKLC